jgi:hypothetical protein
MTNEQHDESLIVSTDIEKQTLLLTADDIVSPTSIDAMTLLLQDCGTSTSRTEFYMELQKQTWALEAVSLQDTPNVLGSIPVTDYVTTSMCPVEIKPTNGNLNRDTFDDSVILQFDPGDTKEKLLDDRSDA